MNSSTLTAIVSIAIFFMLVASMWQLFTKAGQAGWKCLVPVLGALVYLKITGRPWWWLLLFLIPGVNLIPGVMTCFDLARVYGKGAGVGWGLLLFGPIFFMVLAFGDARYVGPAGRPAPAPALAVRRAA